MLYLFTCHLTSGLHMALDVLTSLVLLYPTIRVCPVFPRMGPGSIFKGVFWSVLNTSVTPFAGPHGRQTGTIFRTQNLVHIGCPHKDLSTRAGRGGPISGPQFSSPVACVVCLERGSADIARLSLQKVTFRFLATLDLPGTCSIGASRGHVSKVTYHRTCSAGLSCTELS